MTNQNGNLPWERNDYSPQSEGRKIQSKKALIASAIAFVFLVLGYQSAILVHKVAVVAIVAAEKEDSASQEPPALAEPSQTEAYHAKPAQTETSLPKPSQKGENWKQSVKSNVVQTHRPRETFRFNPNRISQDSLILLGFSQKQAESIVNYRLKGGHFSRASDFGRSYVVSDEMFARLQDYIDIPRLDINAADSAAFDALPGIGPYFAAKMVSQRKALGGFYCCTEQLLDIWNFGQERYDALKDLIFVREEDAGKCRLDIWTASEDSLKSHPYIRNYRTAHNIVLYRESAPPQRHTLEALVMDGILTQESATALSRIVK